MKIEKKHIIVIIVALAALWFLWKKGLFNRLTSKSVSQTPLEGGSTGKDLEYVLTHITFNATERDMIEKVRKNLESNVSWRQSIQAKAYQNGISFDQQLAMDAIWLLYVKEGKWTDDRGWKLTAEIKKL